MLLFATSSLKVLRKGYVVGVPEYDNVCHGFLWSLDGTVELLLFCIFAVVINFNFVDTQRILKWIVRDYFPHSCQQALKDEVGGQGEQQMSPRSAGGFKLKTRQGK